MDSGPYFSPQEPVSPWSIESAIKQTETQILPNLPFLNLSRLPPEGTTAKNYREFCISQMKEQPCAGKQKIHQIARWERYFVLERMPGSNVLRVGKHKNTVELSALTETPLTLQRTMLTQLVRMLDAAEAGAMLGVIDTGNDGVVFAFVELGEELGLYSPKLRKHRYDPTKGEMEPDLTSDAYAQYDAASRVLQQYAKVLYNIREYSTKHGIISWTPTWLVRPLKESAVDVAFGKIERKHLDFRNQRLATEGECRKIELLLASMLRGGVNEFVPPGWKTAPSKESQLFWQGGVPEFYKRLTELVFLNLGIYISHKHWHIRKGERTDKWKPGRKSLHSAELKACTNVLMRFWFDRHAKRAVFKGESKNGNLAALGAELIELPGSVDLMARCHLRVAEATQGKALEDAFLLVPIKDAQTIRAWTKEERELEEAQLLHQVFVFRYGEEEAEAALANCAAQARRSLEHLF